MQSQAYSVPSLVLAGNTSTEQLFSSLDAFLGSPEPVVQRLNCPDSGARVHLDLTRSTREHHLKDAFALVHHLAGRVDLLDITVESELQAGFGATVTVLGKSHGLAVSVR